jgi:SAM-dependent methyltransferase
MAWFDEFFDESYLKTYIHLNRERTVREVDFIEVALELSPEDLILDVPCGFGRHSIELTLRDYKVTGMEYNIVQIEHAKKLMKEKNAFFDIIQADMREIPHEEKYDKMFNYFTSFGYFTDEENEKTMENLNKALKPGGLFLMEMAHRDGILKIYSPGNITRLPEGEILLEERSYNPLTGRMSALHTYITKDGRKFERKFDHRMYTSYELIDLFRRHGFEIVKVYGEGFEDLKTFSRRIAIVGRKINN